MDRIAMSFLNMPKYLFLSILQDWFLTVDLANLDIALCNKQQRSMIMSYLNSGVLSVPGSLEVFVSSVYFEWLLSRSIRTDVLRLSNYFLRVNFDSRSVELFGHVQTLNISYFKQLSHDTLRNVLRCCSKLTSISLTNSIVVNDEDITVLANSCPLITICNLSGLKAITDSSIVYLSEHCKCLTMIDLSDCSLISHTGIQAITTNSTRLSSLIINGNNLTRESMMSIADNCNNRLKVLNVNNVFNILEASIIHFTSLTELCLNYCYNTHTDECLDRIVTNCRLLTKLHIASDYDHRGSAQITDEGIHTLCLRCTLLTDLDISYQLNITVNSFYAIANSLLLRKLQFATSESSVVDHFATYLNLTRMFNTIEIFDSVNHYIEGIPKPLIEREHVDGNNFDIFLNVFTVQQQIYVVQPYVDEILSKVTTSLVKLRINNDILSRDAYIHYSQHWSNLLVLRILCRERNLLDFELLLCAEHCRQLIEFGLYKTNVSNHALSTMLHNNPKLTKLHLEYCNNITDACFVDNNFQCYSRLQHLLFESCESITAVGIRHLISQCKRIRTIYLMDLTKCMYSDVCIAVEEYDSMYIEEINVNGVKWSENVVSALSSHQHKQNDSCIENRKLARANTKKCIVM